MYRKQKGERFKFVTSPNTVFIYIDLVGFQGRHSLTLACRETLVYGKRGFTAKSIFREARELNWYPHFRGRTLLPAADVSTEHLCLR